MRCNVLMRHEEKEARIGLAEINGMRNAAKSEQGQSDTHAVARNDLAQRSHRQQALQHAALSHEPQALRSSSSSCSRTAKPLLIASQDPSVQMQLERL